VFFTCAPIPLMTLNTWWYFASISISGVFAVTFSVVFAYVADVIPGEDERSAAYGLVSATFAASLVMSPALGAYVESAHGRSAVVALATAIAALDVLFVLVAVPESLPPVSHSRGSKSSHHSKGGGSDSSGVASGGVASSWAPLAWESADPFAALRKIGKDKTVLLLCVTVLLSYLPEVDKEMSRITLVSKALWCLICTTFDCITGWPVLVFLCVPSSGCWFWARASRFVHCSRWYNECCGTDGCAWTSHERSGTKVDHYHWTSLWSHSVGVVWLWISNMVRFFELISKWKSSERERVLNCILYPFDLKDDVGCWNPCSVFVHYVSCHFSFCEYACRSRQTRLVWVILIKLFMTLPFIFVSVCDH